MKLAFVILNYNTPETTQRLVDEIQSFSEQVDCGVVVVDNCSTDDSFSKLSGRYEGTAVDVIQSERNGGYSYGNNYGVWFALEKCHPEYIAIANPDILIDGPTVKQLLDTFEADPTIAMCAPVAKNLKGQYSIYSQTLPQFSDDLRGCFTDKAKVIHREGYSTLEGYSAYILTEQLVGSFFVIRSDVFQRIGLLDENVFLFCEERILGFRLKQANYKMILRSDLFYIHAHSESIKKAYNVIQTYKLLFQSKCYYHKAYLHISRMQALMYALARHFYFIRLRLILTASQILRRTSA